MVGPTGPYGMRCYVRNDRRLGRNFGIHGLFDILHRLRRREFIEIILSRQFDICAESISPLSGFVDLFFRGSGDCLQMDVALKIFLRTQPFRHNERATECFLLRTTRNRRHTPRRLRLSRR